MLECDELIVPEELWDRASRKNDPQAKEKLAEMFSGMTLYAHALAGVYGVTVTARELCEVMGGRMTLTIGFDAYPTTGGRDVE